MQIDSELIQSCKKGNRKAQFDLYKQCFSCLMSVCLRYKNNYSEAEESLNMGFFKVLDNLGKYSAKVPFDAWIKRIMINLLIDEFRASKKYHETIEYRDFQEKQSVIENTDSNDAQKNYDAEELELMLKALPPLTQKVFNLYAIDGYNHKEIAEMLGMAEGTSKWHVSSARKQLQEKLNIQQKAEKNLYE